MVLEEAGAGLLLPLSLGGAAMAAGAVGKGRSLRAYLLALAVVAACGVLLMKDASASAERRVRDWLPADGTPTSLHLKGFVLDAPEADGTGERRLRMEASPEVRGGGDLVPVRVLLRVRPSPREAMARLDALRRGDQVRVWCVVRLPRHPGDPDRLDGRRSLLARGLDATGTVKSARLVEVIAQGRTTPTRILTVLKAKARARLDRALPADRRARSVIGAMLLGDRAGLDPADERSFRNSGLVHILSISGLHVSLVVWLLLWILGRTRLGRAGVFVVLACAVAALSFLVGGQSPVVRAALSAGMLVLGRTLGRDGDPLNTLAVVAACVAALRPHVLWDPSYELSFAATAGILAFAGPIAAVLPLPRVLALPLAVSTSAYLASAPLAMLHFGRATPASLVSNLLASLLCGSTLAFGSAAMLFAGVSGLGPLFGRLAGTTVGALLAFASATGRIPGGTFRVCFPSPWFLAVYYLLLFVASWKKEATGCLGLGVRRLLRLLLTLVLGVLHLGPPPPGPSRSTEVAVLDVGQGQAVLLRGPSGGFVLVDAGGSAGGRFDAGERILAPYLAKRGCRRLEALVISHEHDDHVGGAAAILRDFEVDQIWFAAGAHREAVLHELAAEAVTSGTAILAVGRGERLSRAGMEWEVLHPARVDRRLSTNDRSLVLRVLAPRGRILIPGDLEASGEESVLASKATLAADVLVVGHHGASGSTTPRFLEEIGPRVAVISVGAGNRFGHPDSRVLERLRGSGARIFRTDRDGRVRLYTTSRGWRVETGVTASRAESE